MKQIESVKIRQRDLRIDRLVTQAESRGEEGDRLFWTIVHDLEHAPKTTNRLQLEALGFEFPTLEEVAQLEADALNHQLHEILNAMALIRVFLCGCEHLSNRRLLEHLIRVVIQEPVPEIPLCLGAREWVDLSKVLDR
ncbi:MAG: hypothetical protein CBC35_02005 [Planctomycetes bacterium TMED75]|nr:hypothetical protein [Planctomycetaceae bacterium]OUU95940.1 MAG: hypothetical protein CBC35_02005 [Planctomycetes bacterium TMED75]